VALVQYGSAAHLLLEHTPVAEKDKILDAVRRLQSAGSTHLEEGLHLGYQMAARAFVGGAANRVLLLSDGVANLGSDSADDILARVGSYRQQGIFLSVFGFGAGTYNDAMLETLANRGDGSYQFIDSAEEAQRVLVDEWAATLNVVARDAKIQVEFNPARVQRYRQLGYENRQLRKEAFRNDAVDAGEVGSGQSVTALYEMVLHGDDAVPVATVRIRYRDTATGLVREVEKQITSADLVPDFARTDARFKLAAAAAEFAEILRLSPFAAGSGCEDVAEMLRPVALELSLDQRVQELLRLVQTVAAGK
jgi:Ca-activated chloride channel family protein